MSKTYIYQVVYMHTGVRGFDKDGNAVMSKSLDTQLNAYGKDGWQVVDVQPLLPRDSSSCDVLMMKEE